jgi:hypothetical protein
VDQDVGARQQATKLLAALGRLQVCGHTPLVGVEIDEQPALLGIRPVVGERSDGG